MKKLLVLLALAAAMYATQAQTVTNIAYRVTIETGTVGGTTNSVVTNLRLDYGTAKDLVRINGFVYAWNGYKTGGGASLFGDWLKTDIKDRADSYAAVKAQADYTALVAKLTSLLMTNPDLLSASDLTSLNTIAAKAP